MKKTRGFMVVLLMVFICCFSTGCSNEVEITMDEQGKGVINYKVVLDKDAVETTAYTRFNTLDELADGLREKIEPETNLEVRADKTSSTEKDYLIISQSFDSVEDYEKNIENVISRYNMMVSSGDMEDMFGYTEQVDYSEYLVSALKEYLQENVIQVDENERNVRKFAKTMKQYMAMGYYDDFEERSKDDEFYNVKIEEENGNKKLKVNYMAMIYIFMYMRKLAETYSNDIFNNQNIADASLSINGEETKAILKQTFVGINLAGDIKAALDKKFNSNVTNYNMKDFSPVLTAKLFTDEYGEKFQKEYNKQSSIFEENKAKDAIDIGVDIYEELYKERETLYKVTFGNNTVSVDRDGFFENMEDGCLVVANKNIKGNGLKEHNNVFSKDLDSTPFTGDNIPVMWLLVLAAMSVMMMTYAIYSRMRK
ncbi:MAG: hypothetical protein E7262_09055 [Lachnospiraceae bacterium]|nr:hypothetical protein [Lachnospiraceae bacterium]